MHWTHITLPLSDLDAMVVSQGEVKEPIDHLGFQCDSRDEIFEIARVARENGTLIAGPTDEGGSVGLYVMLREPSGHLVEFTHGQPLRGLEADVTPSASRQLPLDP